MKALFKLIHIIIIGFFVITGNSIYDQILSGIIAVIGYIYAFQFTGRSSQYVNNIPILMSFLHWTTRTIVVLFMMSITSILFEFFTNLLSSLDVETASFVSMSLCVASWVIVAETLKSITGLRKKYY